MPIYNQNHSISEFFSQQKQRTSLFEYNFLNPDPFKR